MDIGQWLCGLVLQVYGQAFCDNGVDLDVLRRLTADDLKEIGVSQSVTGRYNARAGDPSNLCLQFPNSKVECLSLDHCLA